MRTPAQQAAARANGALSRGPKTGERKPRSSMTARSLNLLAKTTVVKNESRQGFQELVRQRTLPIAPRDAVDSATWRLHRLRAIEHKTIDLELATQSSPDDLECLAHACGALAGRNPHTRLQNIIPCCLARIEALRRIGPQKGFGQIAPVESPSDVASFAPEP